MKYKNIHLKKFFKRLYKEIMKELKEKPNNKITVKIKLDFGGDTNADVEMITDERILVPDIKFKK